MKIELRNEIVEFLENEIKSPTHPYYFKLKLIDEMNQTIHYFTYRKVKNPPKLELRYFGGSQQRIWIRRKLLSLYAFHYNTNQTLSSEAIDWLDKRCNKLYKTIGNGIKKQKKLQEKFGLKLSK
jgi:hypothetical protein